MLILLPDSILIPNSPLDSSILREQEWSDTSVVTIVSAVSRVYINFDAGQIDCLSRKYRQKETISNAIRFIIELF